MVCTASKSKVYFVLSPRLSVTDTVFTVSFRNKQTRRGRSIVSIYLFLFIWSRYVFISREMCEIDHSALSSDTKWLYS